MARTKKKTETLKPGLIMENGTAALCQRADTNTTAESF